MTSPQSPVSSPQSKEKAARFPSEHALREKKADCRLWTGDSRLTVTDLRKSFTSPTGEKIDVLRGVSFTTLAGEVIAIVGASGTGKSTLLHLLGGLEAPDHGSIAAGRLAIDGASSASLARFRNKHVGFIFQFHHLLPDLSAAENVSLPLRIARTSSEEAMRRARLMLENVGLDSRTMDSVVGRLSGGEQQRVAVCRALITKPNIVLADEPTGNLDTTAGEGLARSLISYAKENQALVIVATHNPAFAEMCDRTLVLNNGRVNEGPPHT
jgi:lipoprotein-releasing system ATP-binding protein